MIQWIGGRNVCLRDQVELYPEHWDVFEPLEEVAKALGKTYDRQAACETMLGFVGKQYGWHNILFSSSLHLPIVRLFITPDINDYEESVKQPFCSQARAIADRAGGVDPVQNLSDRVTEPGDLARSLFYKYKMTLIP